MGFMFTAGLKISILISEKFDHSNQKRLNFLVFAYEDDPFNRPKDLDFLLNRKTSYSEIIGYNCNKGHFTYKKD